MDDADDFHPVGFDEEEDFVGKAAGQDAPHVLVEHRVMERVLGEGAKGGMDFREELVAEGGLAVLVPIEGFGHVGLRLGADNEAVAHFRRDVMRA
jgi:hypothetical protein